MTRARPVVAIDGPAGAGKTTVTQQVAARLGYSLVDTGALYRAVALAVQRRAVAWHDAPRIGEIARALADGRLLRFESGGAGGDSRVLLEGEDVSSAIREPEIGRGASIVSALPAVREALLAMQRDAGSQGGVVLEGRDIGTTVFPDAEAKFYLTASVDVRARRRASELSTRGLPADLDDVRREVIERDARDSNRPVAPLSRASDAALVDSSALEIDEVVEQIVRRVREVEARLAEHTRRTP
ncbi:MAG TPA: (d)CMP kinase [Polyangiaceae bacterium]